MSAVSVELVLYLAGITSTTLAITAANEQDRAQVATLSTQVQQVTGGTIQLAYADQGYTGAAATEQAQQSSIKLEIIKHHAVKRGFVLFPKRWVVERTFGWLGRFRRLARDYERLNCTLAAWHWLACLGLMLRKLVFESA